MTTATTTTTRAIPGLDRRVAATTGLLYLALVVTGVIGFLLIRPQLLDDQAAITAANLIEQAGLARLGIVLELGIVLAQVLAALWFFRLFQAVDGFAAAALALFGAINAVTLLASAAFLATALEIAQDPIGQDSSQVMYLISGNLWGVGNIFFGLWLVPMGYLVLRSSWGPRLLGQLLIVGGAGYVGSAFVTYVLPEATLLASLLVIPATVGEIWMIGWLLSRGLRRR